MTLVIGRICGQELFLLADTRIFDPLATRQNISTGMLKIALLSEGVAVAFTQDPSLAQNAVQEFRSRFGTTVNLRDTIAHFKAATSDNSNEYLLAFAGPLKLYHVYEGRADLKSLGIGWIGSSHAYDRFRSGPTPSPNDSYYRGTIFGPDIEENKRAADLLRRFQNIVEDREIPDVGDFYTLVVGSAGRFRFSFVGGLYFDSKPMLLGPNGIPLLSSSGENRAYRYTVWPPHDPMSNAIAFVFPDPKKAFVFYKKDGGFADNLQLFDGLDGGDLAAEIESQLGIKFDVYNISHL